MNENIALIALIVYAIVWFTALILSIRFLIRTRNEPNELVEVLKLMEQIEKDVWVRQYLNYKDD